MNEPQQDHLWTARRTVWLAVVLFIAGCDFSLFISPASMQGRPWLAPAAAAVTLISLLGFVNSFYSYRRLLLRIGSLLTRLGGQVLTPESPSWHEIAVCSVDIAGLTAFLSSKYSSSFSRLLRIFDAALDQSLAAMVSPSAFRYRLIKPGAATATLVWECPVADEPETKADLALLILDLVGDFHKRFYEFWKPQERAIAAAEPVPPVRLRIALSSGRAWKREALPSSLDYSGLPVIEAGQLMEKALPSGGIVANLHLEPFLFMERHCAHQGELDAVQLRSYNGAADIPIWLLKDCSELQQRVSAKGLREEDSTLGSALAWLGQAYRERELGERLPDDSYFVFELREKWEGVFAADLAKRVRDGQVEKTKLDSIETTVNEMEKMLPRGAAVATDAAWLELGSSFHQQIAELSDGTDGRRRKQFTQMIYDFTRPVYSAATHLPEIVVGDHRDIITAISAGSAGKARGLVQSHLRNHYLRACQTLLESKSGASGLSGSETGPSA